MKKPTFNAEMNYSHIIIMVAYLMSAVWFGAKIDTTQKMFADIMKDHEKRIRILEIGGVESRRGVVSE
jgi:hypothetical protein